MKTYKRFLHSMITFASIASFLGGWAVLAHSGKPAQNNNNAGIDPGSSAALAPLAPLAPLGSVQADQGNNSGFFSFLNQSAAPSSRVSRRRFSSGGS
ncbi:MAG: hypothetical protein WCP19_10065 [Chloroflexota bacterium]